MAAARDETSLSLRPTGFTRRVIGYVVVPFALGVCLAGSAGIVVGALSLVAYVALCRKLGSARLIVDGEGVVVQGAFSSRRLRWEQIERYSYVSQDTGNGSAAAAHAGLVGGVVAAVMRARMREAAHRTFSSGRLVLYGAGRALTVRARYRELPAALDRIFAEVHRRVPPGSSYGPLSFDGETLTHTKAGALSIVEIESVVVGDAGVIGIRKVGKRLLWASVPMAKVDNVMSLFERLIDRGVDVKMSPAVFLATPTLRRLTSATAARAALPAARIHRS